MLAIVVVVGDLVNAEVVIRRRRKFLSVDLFLCLFRKVLVASVINDAHPDGGKAKAGKEDRPYAIAALQGWFGRGSAHSV